MSRRKGNIVGLLVAETRLNRARTPEEREEAAADVVITKVIAGLRLTEADIRQAEESMVIAERRVMAARKVG